MIQYSSQINEEDGDYEVELSRTELIYAQMNARGGRWPRAIGVVEIVTGFLLTILGILEVFILPLIESKDGQNIILLDKGNCYGAGCLAGLAMLVTGSTAIRATLSRRDTTVFRFFNLTIFSLIIYAGLTLFLIIAYYKGWSSASQYEPGSRMGEVHVFVTIFTVLGLLFAFTGFVQYFDVICCGSSSLWAEWVRFFCGCIYDNQGRPSLRESLRAEFNYDSNPI
ncbi:hypothetical protein Btru_047510 [Bulinus truncatus]|nr:hypothetical protein Btru_047510 [Bulinus truncatus]